jgi:hypothetical protein
MITGVDTLLTQLEDLIDRKIEPVIKIVKELNDEVNLSELDIWTEKGRSQKEQSAFKNSLIKFFKRQPSYFRSDLKCMVLNESFKRDEVIASHIWKYSKRGRGLQKFGLTVLDADNSRNGLLMVKSIEERFDIKDLCFLYDAFTQKIFLKVLNPDILTMRVLPSHKTFQEIDGYPLQYPSKNMPFKRLLNFHAKCSFKNAKERGWHTLPSDAVVNDYFNLSDLATMPSIPD